MTWTPEMIELVTVRWLGGASATDIAAELNCGISRNAIIGKVNRLGLAGRERTHIFKSPRTRKTKSRPVPRIKAVTPVAKPAPSVPVTLQQLETHHCRWPIDMTAGPMMYCGAPHVEGLPYCLRHCRIGYRPADVRAA